MTRGEVNESEWRNPAKLAHPPGAGRLIGLLLLPVVVLGAPLVAAPAAAQAPATGFEVRHEASIAGAPAQVFQALVEDVGQWWNPSHTYSGDAANLSIDARPGGCFCESFPDGGGAEHMRVVFVAPGEMLRLSGGLGPLQAFGVAGSLTWTLTGTADGTRVEWSYAVGGFMEDGFEAMAPAVGAVLGEQLQRLQRFVETGSAVEEGDRRDHE